MNIFKILASGSGTLKEPNISAFFKFLLDPEGTHELGCIVLKKILEVADEKMANKLDESYSVALFLEENLTKEIRKNEKIKKSIGDIYIEIVKDDKIVCLIYIEIKIRNSLQKNNQVLSQNIDISQFSKNCGCSKILFFSNSRRG